MQLLRYVLIILVGVSLSANTCDVLATSAVHVGKGQTQYYGSKAKASNNTIDVWERIRLGLKIPNQTPTALTQALIPDKNRPVARAEAVVGENSLLISPPKYIIHPQAVIAPVNNYTALGLRLKFGTKVPSANNEDCIPSISTQTLQQATPKSKSIANAENIPPMRKRTVLISANNGILQTKQEVVDPLTQATNNLKPCVNSTGQQLVGASKQVIQAEDTAQIVAKKAMINDRVNKQIALFSQSPGYLYQVAERARPYLYHIVERLSTSQLPLDLALLPIVESGYQPKALSPKGAAGLWQFIPSTGNEYDLKQSNHYDDRLDILASTQAAIRFLSHLKGHFNGDWLLALAAYNCGQGAVDKAISRNLSEGLDTDYWSLRLPEETQDYVPRLLALSNIFANPEIYGLKFSPIKNEPYFVKVKINREVDIKYLTDKNFAVLAKLANLSHEQFSRLNPGYLNPSLSTQQSYTFLLPLANANQLHQLLTSIAQFMAEPVSDAMNSSGSEFISLPYSWDLSPNESSIKLIKFSQLSKEI